MNAISKRLAQIITAEQQDLLALEVMERVQVLAKPPLDLSAEERGTLEAELTAARRSALASDAEVAAMYAKHGL